MARSRLDLPLEAFSKPQWWSNAIYRDVPGRGLVFQGYTKPALRTFDGHVASVMSMPGARVSWVWFGGEWVRVA
jgi:hypothetical protein